MDIIFYLSLVCGGDEASSHQEEDARSLHAGQNQASLDYKTPLCGVDWEHNLPQQLFRTVQTVDTALRRTCSNLSF
jgi:hypothetical protein